MNGKTTLSSENPSFRAVATEWHEQRSYHWDEGYAKRRLILLERHVFPFIGHVPIKAVTASEVRTVLFRVQTRSLFDAHKVQSICNNVFEAARQTGLIEHNPTLELVGILPPTPKKVFAAPMGFSTFAALLRAIDHHQGSIVVKCALQLAPLVLVRPGELRQPEWAEIDFVEKQLILPAGKRWRRHLVPLSSQALTILDGLHSFTGHGRYVFPCNHSPHKCLSDNAINIALRRLGFGEMSCYGFRSMGRIILRDVLKIDRDLIDDQLEITTGHRTSISARQKISMRDSDNHYEARRKMMQDLADYYDEMKGGERTVE